MVVVEKIEHPISPNKNLVDESIIIFDDSSLDQKNVSERKNKKPFEFIEAQICMHCLPHSANQRIFPSATDSAGKIVHVNGPATRKTRT